MLAQELPAQSWLVWASNRQDSRHEIYRMRGDGGELTRLTHEGGKLPAWSPDGAWISYQAADGSVRAIRSESGEQVVLLARGVPRFWLHDGTGLFVSDPEQRYYLVQPESGQQQYLYRKTDFSRIGDAELDPSGITHDGRYLVAHTTRFFYPYAADNGIYETMHAAVVLDLADKDRLYFFGLGCEPTTPPAGPLIYHVCGRNELCPQSPDLIRMNIADLMDRASYAAEVSFADEQWGHEYFPRVSNDNRWLAYGASTGCHDHDSCDYEIFVHPLDAGTTARTRLTVHPQNDQWPDLWVALQPAAPFADAGNEAGAQRQASAGSLSCSLVGRPGLPLFSLMLLVLACLRAVSTSAPQKTRGEAARDQL